MRTWVLLPATVAPVALVGAWTWAATRQPPGYSAVSQTISALAARDATDRWIMTTGLALLGLAHVGTAVLLGRAVRLPARVVLAVGGLATVAVSLFPQPAGDGSSTAHVVAATVGFVALTLWVPFAHDGRAALPLRTAATLGATVVLAGLLVTFGVTLSSGVVGVTERLLAAAQALWPWVVAVGLLATRRARSPVRPTAAAAAPRGGRTRRWRRRTPRAPRRRRG